VYVKLTLQQMTQIFIQVNGFSSHWVSSFELVGSYDSGQRSLESKSEVVLAGPTNSSVINKICIACAMWLIQCNLVSESLITELDYTYDPER
jgi:hypothetical protein